MKSLYDNQLQEIFNIQRRVVSIHPFLERVFPVALVEGNQFLIYDIDESGQRYVFGRNGKRDLKIRQDYLKLKIRNFLPSINRYVEPGSGKCSPITDNSNHLLFHFPLNVL